jgi:hypothetical protein
MTKDIKIICSENSPGRFDTYISGADKWKKGNLVEEVNKLSKEGYDPISIGGTCGGSGDVKNEMKLCVLMIKK